MAIWQTIQNMRELGSSINEFWPALCTAFSRDCNLIYIAEQIYGEADCTACQWTYIYENRVYVLKESVNGEEIKTMDTSLSAWNYGAK